MMPHLFPNIPISCWARLHPSCYRKPARPTVLSLEWMRLKVVSHRVDRRGSDDFTLTGKALKFVLLTFVMRQD